MIKYANKSGPMAEHTHFQAHTTVLCLFKSIGHHEAVDSATAVNAVNRLAKVRYENQDSVSFFIQGRDIYDNILK